MTILKTIPLTFMVACFALSGCSIEPKADPKPSDYAVSFSIDPGPQFLIPPSGQYQVQFEVNVSKWGQDYDKKDCEVFLIVTTKSTPVVDLETDNANNFAYGGWFDLDSENRALKTLGLQPIHTATVANNWFNVINTTQTSATFDARTERPVNPSDWRFVIMAIRSERNGVNVLWTKVISPS